MTRSHTDKTQSVFQLNCPWYSKRRKLFSARLHLYGPASMGTEDDPQSIINEFQIVKSPLELGRKEQGQVSPTQMGL